MAMTASFPKIVMQLFGVGALWIACVIGYLTCFVSPSICMQGLVRLAWSQAQRNPDHYLTRLSSRHIPNSALNAVLGYCMVSTSVIHALEVNLNALIIYADGTFIMIYLLCMLASCKLLQGRYRLLVVAGGLLYVLLLIMIDWKSLYALIMLVELRLPLPKRKTPKNGITTQSGVSTLILIIVFMIKAVVVIILSLALTIESITAVDLGVKTATWYTEKTQMRYQFHCRTLLHRRQ